MASIKPLAMTEAVMIRITLPGNPQLRILDRAGAPPGQ